MKIAYQGEPWAYGSIASDLAAKALGLDPVARIESRASFSEVWDSIDRETVAVLPIENSYAGSVYENLYHFLRYDARIIGEIRLDIRHCLLSRETDIADIRVAYSHEQALRQCHDFLKARSIAPIAWSDTAGAAKMLSEQNIPGAAAIASSAAGAIYGLNALASDIQDQDGNTTRFFVLVPSDSSQTYPHRSGKVSILFETADTPAALYKCLGAFATHAINLSKIESLPSRRDPFTYLFWVDFQWSVEDPAVLKALEEVRYFTKSLKVLGSY